MITQNQDFVNIGNTENVLKDGRRKGWFWDYNDVFDSDLSLYAKVVRLYLARCADNENRAAWPSYNKIAKDCGMSRKTAQKAVTELEEKGWIKKYTRKKSSTENDSNVYVLCDPPSAGNCSESGGGVAGTPPGNKITGGVPATLGGVSNTPGGVPQTPGGVPGTLELYPENNTHNNKLLVSKDTNNSELALRASSPVVGLDIDSSKNQKATNAKGNKKHDSHSQASVADAVVNAFNEKQPNQGRSMPINQPSANELIAELVREYRALEGVKPMKGDYSFIGGLHNKYGYDAVYIAINELSMAMAAQEVRKPLLYLGGILNNLGEKNNSKISDNKLTGGDKYERGQSKSKPRCARDGNSEPRKLDQDQKEQSTDESFTTFEFPEGFDIEEYTKDPDGYYAKFFPND